MTEKRERRRQRECSAVSKALPGKPCHPYQLPIDYKTSQNTLSIQKDTVL
jgi:hypothetical protein